MRSGRPPAAAVAVALLLTVAPGAQEAPRRPRVTGISHVALRVTDAASARGFYQDVLGLSERASPSAGRVTYAIGRRQHVLLEPGLPAGEDERLSHVAFETPDVGALSAYLASRGVAVRHPAGRCEPSAIRVTDPDGHPIEFVQASWPPDGTADPGRALSTRLLHAGLIIRDEQAAHRFYRDTLGFSEIWRGGRTGDATDWINMRVPDGTDYLEYMLQTADTDRRQRGVLHHVCLLVDDIQDAWETVAARTAPAARPGLSPPNVGRNGRWQLNLYDPDGTRTELMEPFRVR